MNENHVDLKQINYLLGQEGLSAERKTQLEAFKAQYEALVNQVNTIQETLANLTNNFNKVEEEIKLEREHERLSGLINHYTEINKTSLTDYEANFRRTMMKEDGSGLIQRLFACIEKDPRYSNSPTYKAAKEEIKKAFENPFKMEEFVEQTNIYIATRKKYRELIAKDPNNYAEISPILTELKELQDSIITEANKYVFNKEKLETLFEQNIHQLSLLGSYEISAERNAILNEIQKVYEPFHDRFDSERRLKFYTQDLAKIEAQMAELGVKKAESKTATQGTPVTPASSVGTATNPTGTNPENDPETKNHSGLHFIGLPNDKYYDSVRDAYRYGDEIEIDKEEEIDGTTFITLKGSDVKIKKNLFATTADIEDEFKHAMKAHKTSTNQIKAGMKVTPCWPGHYNRAILKKGSRGNEADIEVKNMKLHDEIEVEKVFYKGTRKFVKLVGYENAFSADSFAIAPSTIKEIAEKKEAAKKAKEELKAKKQKTGPENEQQAQVSEQQTPENEPVVEKQKQSVSDMLNEAENTAEKDAFFSAEDKATFQTVYDEAYEESHDKKTVTATEETPDKQTKQKARVGAIAGIANNERTPLRARIASMWSLITSKAGKTIKGKIVDIAQKIVDKAKTQGASEEELKEAMDIQAEAVRQSGVEPAKQQQELSI